MGKSFTPNAPRTGAASAAPRALGKPGLVRSGDAAVKRRHLDDAPSPKPLRDPLSERLGDTLFAQDAMFGWCADAAGIRLPFYRHYVRARVLVDVFGIVTDAVRREVAAKSAAIAAYNAEHPEAQIGYVPHLTGVLPGKDDVEYAMLGGIVPLREPLVA